MACFKMPPDLSCACGTDVGVGAAGGAVGLVTMVTAGCATAATVDAAGAGVTAGACATGATPHAARTEVLAPPVTSLMSVRRFIRLPPFERLYRKALR